MPDPTPPDPAGAGRTQLTWRQILLRSVLWWILVVAIFLFIAVMFGGLRPDR